MVEKVNLIVATGHNNAGICMSVKRAAEKLIHNWKVDQGLLNMVEMAFRAYDPCLACATHALLGEIPSSSTSAGRTERSWRSSSGIPANENRFARRSAGNHRKDS